MPDVASSAQGPEAPSEPLERFAPPAIFPLPGGAGVAMPGWVPPPPEFRRLNEAAGLPESTADRRHYLARRGSLRLGGPCAGPNRADVPLRPTEGPARQAPGAEPEATLERPAVAAL